MFTLDGIEDDELPKMSEEQILEAMAKMLNAALDKEIMETLRKIREDLLSDD